MNKNRRLEGECPMCEFQKHHEVILILPKLILKTQDYLVYHTFSLC